MNLLLPQLLTLGAALVGSAYPAPIPSASPSIQPAQEARFPSSTPEAEGLDPQQLQRVSDLVQSLVDDDEVVGAELLVIKNGRSVLHEAYGMNHREEQIPMQVGNVFCVRSMTKPLVASGILMLLEEDLVELDDPVAKYLPSFDVEGSQEITIEHLLTHTAGLPMSLIIGKDLKQLGDIGNVADLGGGYELDFTPGSRLNYSDQGTDTLTAVIEVVGGMPVERFMQERLLDPLGMRDTATVLEEGHHLRERGCSKYVGSRGAWSRYWDPSKPPLFPFFLGSQALYSTLEDYARFMDLWLHRGRLGKQKLLSKRFIRKALRPSAYPLGSPTGFEEARADYGYLMQLWTSQAEAEEGKLLAFGHTGSDGTHAWVFPEQKAMVLYFTQSRGNSTGLQVEQLLSNLFLGSTYTEAPEPPALDPYLGYYYEGGNDVYRGVVRDGDGMALEILGRGVVPLVYVGGESWKMRNNPSNVLEFDRAEDGQVTGFHIGTHQEVRVPELEDLPSIEELAERVAGTYRMDLLESLGALRLEAQVTFPKLGIEATSSTTLAWPGHFRVDSSSEPNFERIAYDGVDLWSHSSARPLERVGPERAALLRLDHPFARFGQWSDWYPELRIVQRLLKDDRQVFLVRTGDTSGPASTLYVEWESGRLLREDGLTQMEGLGLIGRRLTFMDHRELSGMTFPHSVRVDYAHGLIGHAEQTITGHEFGVVVTPGTFQLKD